MIVKLLVYIPLYSLVLAGVIAFFTPRKLPKEQLEHKDPQKAAAGSPKSLYSPKASTQSEQDWSSKPAWGPWESVAITVAVYFIAQLIGWALIAGYLTAMHGSMDAASSKLANSVGVQLFYITIVDGLMAALVYGFMQRRKTLLRAVGLVKPAWGNLLHALIGFGIYFAAYGVVLTVLHVLIPGLNVSQKQELGFDTTGGSAALAMAFVGLVVLPPLVEEFVMRGFLFSGLRTKLAFLPSAVIMSVLFAAAHLQAGSGNALLWVAAIDTFVLSMVLAGLREQTRSLWPGVGVHAIKNGLAFMALFVFHVV